MTTLAGCSSVSGPSGEVIKNEFTNVEVSDLQIENTEVLGTKAVQAKFVLENTGTEETVVHVKTEFYNDDVLVGTDGASYVNVTVSPGDRVEETQVIEGRVEDITSYEISLLKAESVSI
jgi:hypothetical protein